MGFLSLLIAFLKLLIAYDAWCVGRVEALLKGLEEWLSISQKRAERGMIAVYMLLVAVPSSWTLGIVIAQIGVAAGMGYMMWTLHRRPAAVRERSRQYLLPALFRVLMQAFTGSIMAILFLLPPHRLCYYAAGSAQAAYLLFFYMIDIHSGGERGQRRRLAWAELKKLFGAEWIPRPAPEVL